MQIQRVRYGQRLPDNRFSSASCKAAVLRTVFTFRDVMPWRVSWADGTVGRSFA